MKIAFLTRFYEPVIGAGSLRITSFVKFLSKNKNYKIDIITEFPNYPAGIIDEKYKGKFISIEEHDNVKIHRLYCYSSPKGNFITRVLNEISFFFSSFFYVIKFRGHDFLIISSPPFVLLFNLFWMKIFHTRPKIIVDIRDLHPDTAIEPGYLKNKLLIKILYKIEKLVYKYADCIFTVTNTLKHRILKKIRLNSQKIFVLSNGADLDYFYNRGDKNSLREKLGWNKDKFIVLYTGSLSIMDDMQILIEAANLLKNQSDIQFIIMGHGYLKQELVDLANEFNLDNVIFLDNSYRKRLAEMLSAADIGFVNKIDLELTRGHLPVKMFEYCACNLPFIACLDGETKDFIEKYNIGFYSPPGDYKKLAEKILYLKNNKDLIKKDNRYYEVIEKYYSREIIANKLKDILESLDR